MGKLYQLPDPVGIEDEDIVVLFADETSADEVVQRSVKGGASDPNLAALYFTFGRYLLLSGGREGSSGK